MSTPAVECLCSNLCSTLKVQLPINAHHEKQQVTAHILGFLSPLWKTCRKFQTPLFSQSQLRLLQAFGT